MRRLCVFCGANPGIRESYKSAAAELGSLLAQKKIGLVYGGGRTGLMGVIADAALAAGGEVTGIIPESLVAKEVAHDRLTDLRVVRSMHERKAMMADMSDAFVAMPGGFGTFEEWFEVVTWSQLGIHQKACGLLNVDGFYTPLLAMVEHAANEGFIRPQHQSITIAAPAPIELLGLLEAWVPPTVEKWVEKSKR